MPALPALAAEVLACLCFYTRLPLPALALEAAYAPQPFARCLRWAPLAGAVVGAGGAVALALASNLGLPSFVAVTLALLATVLLGGGLHEDGLADLADGFGGGRSRERKLDIMRDSRLGSYGALAIGFSLLLRAACLVALADDGGPVLAAAALISAGAASRGFGLMPMALLPPARSDGLAQGAGRLPTPVFPTAMGLAVVFGLAIPVLAGAPWIHVGLALGLAALAAAWITRLARRQIGGHTGDVAGACQQLCELALLLGLLIGGPMQ